MVDLSPNTIVITLNIQYVNILDKREINRMDNNRELTICWLQETYFKCDDLEELKVTT